MMVKVLTAFGRPATGDGHVLALPALLETKVESQISTIEKEMETDSLLEDWTRGTL